MSVTSVGTKGLAGLAGALMLLAAGAAMPTPARADWHGGGGHGGWHGAGWGGGWHGGWGWRGGYGYGYGWGPGIGVGFWGYPYGYYAPYYGAYYAPYAYPYYAPPVAYVPVRVAAAPAPAAPAVQAQPQHFTVFFDFNKDTLTAEGRHVVDRAVAEARRGHATRIDVTGYTDLAGTHTYNQALSERRAETVRRYMVAHGLRNDEIAVAARGEADPRVPTRQGMREAQNRRVEIVIYEGHPAVAGAPRQSPAYSSAPPMTAPVVRAYAAPVYGYRLVNAAPGWVPPPYPAVYRTN